MAKEPTESEIKRALTNFAEASIEATHHRHEDILEPFEAYELYLREQMHKNPDQFKERFVRGYFTLTSL